MSLPGNDLLTHQDPYQALYVHIPFCKSKCVYCDFASEAVKQDDERIEAYIDSLILQIRQASRADLLGSLETVYIGGGTPTHIGNKQLSRLLYALSLSMHLTPEVECTLEANPESLTEAMVKDLFALGVTRLSIGVQTFDDALLNMLGRAHTAQKAKEAIKSAKMRFKNISIDLMCGLPGQTKESFDDSLKTALELEIPHISIYPLTIEDGTPLQRLMNSAAFSESEDDLSDASVEMMLEAQRLLETHGYHRYEVASYALEGYECTHNKAYWTGKPYLGIGAAAVTMKQNDQMRVRVCEGALQEKLNHNEALIEDLMLGMRMSRGVLRNQVEAVDTAVSGTLATFEQLKADGYLIEDQGRFKPTQKGWLWGNVLYGAILDLTPHDFE